MPEAPPRDAADPLLSVVVTIVDGGASLERLLNALSRQADPPPLELLVPHDATLGDLSDFQARFPTVKWLDLGEVRTERPTDTAAGQHELYDRRRAAGLAAASGALVAIVEDRGAPRGDWARTAVRLHQTHEAAVIGGAIEPVRSTLLNWAFWVCDFSRYGLPFAGGPARWVSDVNVTYKRAALEATRDLWRDRYQEPVVHWALESRGETLFLAPGLVVLHLLPPQRLAALLPQRFDWGRLFGAIRARTSSPAARLALVLRSPLVPLVLLARHGRVQFRRGEGWRYCRAVPILLLMLTAWTLGETWGTITGRG
jgi:hypothetical protein